jgi:hypothetical protein
MHPKPSSHSGGIVGYTEVIQEWAPCGSVPGSQLGGTNFYACSSRGRIRLQAEMIVNRIAKTLLAAQVSLGRLN